MIVTLSNLERLPVYTESGTKLGQIYELEIDANTHTIMRYLARSSVFSPKYFLIKNSQIKDITEDKVIVYDNILKLDAVLGNVMSKPEEDV